MSFTIHLAPNSVLLCLPSAVRKEKKHKKDKKRDRSERDEKEGGEGEEEEAYVPTIQVRLSLQWRRHAL